MKLTCRWWDRFWWVFFFFFFQTNWDESPPRFTTTTSARYYVYLRVRFSLVGWRDVLWVGMSTSMSEMSEGGNRKRTMISPKSFTSVSSIYYLLSYTIRVIQSCFYFHLSLLTLTSITPSPFPLASPSNSELLSWRRSSSLLGALSATSGMLTRNLRSSLRTVMVSFPLLFSTRCLVSSRDRFSVVMPLIWSNQID